MQLNYAALLVDVQQQSRGDFGLVLCMGYYRKPPEYALEKSLLMVQVMGWYRLAIFTAEQTSQKWQGLGNDPGE